jgi:hypothetical protein
VWQERHRFEQVKRDIAAKGADDDGTGIPHMPEIIIFVFVLGVIDEYMLEVVCSLQYPVPTSWI